MYITCGFVYGWRWLLVFWLVELATLGLGSKSHTLLVVLH